LSWRRLGLVWSPRGELPWQRSHAALPVALAKGDHHRVFVATRDERNRSYVGWVDARFADGAVTILAEAERPALAPGPPGQFDGDGVYPASLVEAQGRLLLYYVGWNAGSPPPLFYASVGLAESDDGGVTFRRIANVPVLARGEHDPCLVTSPCVRREGGTWRMWYVSGFAWREIDGALRSIYDIKYAESDDGLEWRRDGRVALALLPGETNLARPCVTGAPGAYEMWFARNAGRGYTLGLARSTDGRAWTRDDAAGDLGGPGGVWESDGQAYPWIVESDRRYLLYNGNGYGRTGFGAAVEAG
jgi:hypothetical protein